MNCDSSTDGRPVWHEEVRGIVSLQLYSRQACRSLLDYAKAANSWADAEVGVEEPDGDYGSAKDPEYRLASSLSPHGSSRLSREFNDKMRGVIIPLVNDFWKTDLQKYKSTHLVRYGPGDFYRTHSDTTPEQDYRYFTVLCYLNDDFQGGQTSFPAISYSVRPRPGKAIIFPSSYLHCSEPISLGEKYVIVSWLTGPPPINWL